MASTLNNNSLIVNNTQEITGISNTVNEGNYNEIPTAKAIYDLLAPLVLVSLTISGDWSNPQYTNTAVDATGLSFTATFLDGSSKSVTPSVSPSTWSSTAGTQTATFSYSENGVTVSGTKDASVVLPSIALTGASSRTIVFYSISGNLYTDSACTTKASTNTKYTNKTFYYKSNESKPSASYIYNYGDGAWGSDLPSKDTLTNYTTEMKTLFDSSGGVWCSTLYSGSSSRKYWYYNLPESRWIRVQSSSTSYHRVQLATL